MYIKTPFFTFFYEVLDNFQDIFTGKGIFYKIKYSTYKVFLQFDVKISEVNFDLSTSGVYILYLQREVRNS
jgi:hypothetical protein